VKLVIVNYGSGNLRSVAKAFERAGLDSGWDGQVSVSDDPAQIAGADYIVLPGVGAFGDCARGLAAIPGMHTALGHAVREKQRPFLGICVGMQLLADKGLEHGVQKGFGWISGEVRILTPSDASLKIPHMGWNTLSLTPAGRAHPALRGLADGGDCYFLHSYHFAASRAQDILAETEYGGRLTAAIGRDNILGVQFHPEKSQTNGLRLLADFLRWKP
jgi:imidazole glycerol-phosphate synthase subunit HisH